MSNNQQIIDAPSERTIRTRTVKYSGYVIETTVEEYELNENTVLTRDVVEMPGAVAVAVLNDNNELLMLNQYRHPVRMNLWEVPAGLLDIDGEDPLVAAQRELAEEADLQAETWNALTDYFSSPGATSEAGRVYLARNLSELPAEERSERTEEEAEMTYRWVPLAEAVQLVLGGKVHNALAIHFRPERQAQTAERPDSPSGRSRVYLFNNRVEGVPLLQSLLYSRVERSTNPQHVRNEPCRVQGYEAVTLSVNDITNQRQNRHERTQNCKNQTNGQAQTLALLNREVDPDVHNRRNNQQADTTCNADLRQTLQRGQVIRRERGNNTVDKTEQRGDNHNLLQTQNLRVLGRRMEQNSARLSAAFLNINSLSVRGNRVRAVGTRIKRGLSSHHCLPIRM